MAAIASLALFLAACGGGSDSLSLDDQSTVATFRADVALTALDGSRYAELLDSTEAVIVLARERPDALYETDEAEGAITMRQVLSDAASDLAPYQPEISHQLDRAVATLD